jgi:hypothetical protein
MCFGFLIIAQSTNAQQLFDNEVLEELKEDDDYNYEELGDQTSLWTDFKEWFMAKIKEIFGIDNFNGFWEFVFDILPYVGILIFLLIIIWYLVKYNTGSQIMRQHDKSNVTLTEEEELLMKKDLEDLANKAIENEQYKLAVRYLYLFCLKRLDMKRLVRFSNEKTNFDYVKEIQQTDIALAFKTITISYEQIWYGGLVFDKFYFSKISSIIKKFHQKLDQVTYAQV